MKFAEGVLDTPEIYLTDMSIWDMSKKSPYVGKISIYYDFMCCMSDSKCLHI